MTSKSGSGVSILVQLVLLASVGKSVVPFFKHSLALLPVATTLLGIVCLFCLICVAFLAVSDRFVDAYQVTSKAALKQSLFNATLAAGSGGGEIPGLLQRRIPVQYDWYCRATATNAAIYAMALLCLVAWLMSAVQRGYRGLVLPMFSDLRVVDDRVWAEFEDWRALDYREQQKQAEAGL